MFFAYLALDGLFNNNKPQVPGLVVVVNVSGVVVVVVVDISGVVVVVDVSGVVVVVDVSGVFFVYRCFWCVFCL